MNQSLSAFMGSISREDTRKYLAEFIGTFVLVFIGCGVALVSPDLLTVSIAFGFVVMALFYAIGGISGCHINPAVTVAMLITGKIGGRDAGFYIIAQCIGAIIAALVLWGIFSGIGTYSLVNHGLWQNGYGAASPLQLSLGICFMVEVVLTFIFLLVILGATGKKSPREFAGLAIGLALVVVTLIGVNMTRASFNPARSLGPAVIVRGQALS